MPFLKSLTCFLATSTVPVPHWHISRCYCISTEKVLEKRVVLTWILQMWGCWGFLFVFFSLPLLTLQGDPVPVLEYPSFDHEDPSLRLRGILQKIHKWFWPTQWFLWLSMLTIDLLFPDFLLHENNKIRYWFKLLWTFFSI